MQLDREQIKLQLQDLYQSRTGGSQLPARVWDYLCRKPYVADVEAGRRTIDWLCDEAWEVVRTSPEADRITRNLKRDNVLSEVHQDRADRQSVLSLLIAREARQVNQVIAFRRIVLKNRLLSPNKVELWIKRQAQEDGSPTPWLHVPVPQGYAFKSGLYTEPTLVLSKAHPATGRNYKVLDYVVPGSQFVGRLPVSHGGILEQLQSISEYLAAAYNWQEALATHFILTDKIPFIASIRAEVSTGKPGHLSLKIDLALTPRQVAEEYRRFRVGILGKARIRTLSQKHLRLAEFNAVRPEGESWRARWAKWNKAYPKWKYLQESNFRRDSAKAKERLLAPGVPIETILGQASRD